MTNPGWCSGEDNNNARVSNAEACAARQLRADFHMTVQELANMYNMSKAAMSYLLRGITYQYVGGPIETSANAPHPRRMTDDEVRTARQIRHNERTSSNVLAKQFGVSKTSMRYALRGVTHRDAGGPIEPSLAQKLGERKPQGEGKP